MCSDHRCWWVLFFIMCIGFSIPGEKSARAADSTEFGRYGLGRAAHEGEILQWNIDIGPQGEGLPPGRGSVHQGASVYAARCAGCHGPTGLEGPMPALVGGIGTLGTDHPVKTVGSYWPYATTLYDYVFRAMPPTAPQSLTPDQVYALVAWILFRNGIVQETDILTAQTLPTIRMPNREGFVPNSRPDVPMKGTP